MNLCQIRHLLMLIGCMILGSNVSASTTPAASTADATLVKIATAASSITALSNDPQSRMFNYLKYHFGPAATRLSTVCNMTAVTFSGTASDAGVIFGLENNTDTTFMIMQGSNIIGQVEPGWNSDVVLNLAVLSNTTTTPLTSFRFVPTVGGAQLSQLIVRVMTGQQLFTHIQNEQKRESSTATISWYKNGNNPLPGAGDLAATGTDLYLVVENETLTTGTPLTAAVKRIQVLNLSNITNLYTVSLSISSMGLALVNNKVAVQQELDSVYAIAIQGVHLLNEVQGHTVPLLMMPRGVYQAGSGVNTLYAACIEAYANALGKQYAGTAPVYYNLSIWYAHEPFEYLRNLKYFDMNKSLLAVVDQNAAVSSGDVVGSMIVTDVYGAYAQAVSPDLSWVACNQSQQLDTTDNKHVLFSLGGSLASESTTVNNVTTQQQPAVQAESPNFVGGMFGQMFKQIAEIKAQQQQQAATVSKPDQQSASATPGFPMTNISYQVLTWTNGINVHVQTHSNINYPSSGASYFPSMVSLYSPTDVTAGQSYNSIGSFPNFMWNLTLHDWTVGIKMVPVFYDATKCAPFTNMVDFNRVSNNAKSALYFYVYRGDTNEFLGVLPVCIPNNLAINLFPMATPYMYMFAVNNNMNIWGFEPEGYDNFAVAKGTDVSSKWNDGKLGVIPGYTNIGQINLFYPGYYYWIAPSAGNGSAAVLGKYSDISKLNTLVQQTWATQTSLEGTWVAPISAADVQTGVIVQITNVGNNAYKIVLFDAQKNVLGFQELYTPSGASQLVATDITASGGVNASSKLMSVSGKVSYFKLMDTAASGIVMVPVAAPAAVGVKKTTVNSVPVKKAPISKSDARLIAINRKLEKQNAALRKKIASLESKKK